MLHVCSHCCPSLHQIMFSIRILNVILFALMLFIATDAQITFSRDWLAGTGKRSQEVLLPLYDRDGRALSFVRDWLAGSGKRTPTFDRDWLVSGGKRASPTFDRDWLAGSGKRSISMPSS